MTSIDLHNLIQNFNNENLVNFIEWKNQDFKPIEEEIDEIEVEGFEDIKKLGEIQFSTSEALILCSIKVTKNLTERSGKKAQFDLAKKVLNYYADAYDGIFVFHDDDGNFRFSLIFANYFGNRKSFSNYRRFTYFIEKDPENKKNKTFRNRMKTGDFNTLDGIKETFSVEKVTKEFYEKLSYWYFWACDQCRFPEAAEKEKNGREISVIRMITRIIFIWFMREKGLVRKDLFDEEIVRQWLKNLDPQSTSYYQAILQNLFFATLNTKQEERKFRSEIRGHSGYNPDFGNQYVYRFQSMFTQPEKMQDYFRDIPFLNGGLFDSLDNPEEGEYYEGFSEIVKNQAKVPNRLFFSAETDADFNEELGTKGKSYRVTGLLDILSSFNFTIDENTADDKEVALDPELLGRVFENLLASFNPETASTARKSTGSYYTPREIVDYMVDESLEVYFRESLSDIENLDQKVAWLFSQDMEHNPFSSSETKNVVELIEGIRIVDPAVGSGAFPMGILNKLVFLLSKLDPHSRLWQQAQLDAAQNIPDPQIRINTQASIRKYFEEKNPDYGRKLFLIQKCIYGVDVQQIAVEISKLRFFISLLVDETVEKTKPNWGIEPLPNLDFKIMQGNSLISTFEGINFDPRSTLQPTEDLFSAQDEKQQLIKIYQGKKELYQSESDHRRKGELREEIDQILVEILKNVALTQKKEYATVMNRIQQKYAYIQDPKKRADLISADQILYTKQTGIDIGQIELKLKGYSKRHMVRDFFPWGLYFSEVFSEKGGFDVVIGNPPYVGEKGHKNLFENVKKANLSNYYLGKMDFFYFFFHLGLDLCRSKGCVVLITTNYYPTATGAVKLRKDFKTRATIIKLVNFNEMKVFETAMGQHNMITMLMKDRDDDKDALTCITERTGSVSSTDLLHIINWKDSHSKYYKVAQKDLYDGDSYQIRLTGLKNDIDKELNSILNKIRSKGTILGELCNINTGIQTGADKVTLRHCQKFHISQKPGKGIFVLSDQEVEALNPSFSDLKLLKPWFKNSDISRWTTNNASGLNVIYFDRTTPPNKSLVNYLSQFRLILESRREVINQVIDWWQLQWPRINEIFTGEKIVAPQRSHVNTFGYNETDWYASADVYFITEKNRSIDLKYVLALLNSKIYYVWLYHRGKRKGEMLELYQTPLSEIPIPKISKEDQKRFIINVDEILSLANSEDYLMDKIKQESVNSLEQKNNQLVYELLGLSESEISYIEGLERFSSDLNTL